MDIISSTLGLCPGSNEQIPLFKCQPTVVWRGRFILTHSHLNLARHQTSQTSDRIVGPGTATILNANPKFYQFRALRIYSFGISSFEADA